MKNALSFFALLCATVSVGCDETPGELTAERLEAQTDLELQTPEELVDADAPEPADERAVDTERPTELQTSAVAESPNPSNVPWTISPGSTCLNSWQCPIGQRCDAVPIPGQNVRKCVASCTSDASCQSGETCGADGFCDVLVKGDWDFCLNGGCLRGHADCDASADCEGSLSCMLDTGTAWGYASSFADVCDFPAGHASYCSGAHQCGGGQGDCDSNTDCAFGLVCKQDRGPQFGFASWVDVCLLPWQ